MNTVETSSRSEVRVRCGDCRHLIQPRAIAGDPFGTGYRCRASGDEQCSIGRLVGHVYDIRPLWCPTLAAGETPAVQNDQGEQPCAGGTGSRWLTPAVRYFLVSILPLILALIALVALLWMRPAKGTEHPFGEAGQQRRGAIK
jgi:hypothetical protein